MPPQSHSSIRTAKRLRLAFLCAIACAPELTSEPYSTRCGLFGDFGQAELVACAASESLLAPSDLLAEIEADLRLIHAAYPRVGSIYPELCPVPGYVIVQMESAAAAESVALGRHAGMSAAYEKLGAPNCIEWSRYSGNFVTLTFEEPYQGDQLSSFLYGVEDVDYAEGYCVGYLPCSGPTYIFRTAPHEYEFHDDRGCNDTQGPAGWDDWIFRVEGDEVLLLSHNGVLMPTESTSWGRIKARYR